jgi:hypothetical protein
MELLPWEHATSGLCCRAAEKWLTVHNRSFRRVHIVEWWAVFYESAEHEARFQRWEIDDKGALVPAGIARPGWPLESVA